MMIDQALKAQDTSRIESFHGSEFNCTSSSQVVFLSAEDSGRAEGSVSTSTSRKFPAQHSTNYIHACVIFIVIAVRLFRDIKVEDRALVGMNE